MALDVVSLVDRYEATRKKKVFIMHGVITLTNGVLLLTV